MLDLLPIEEFDEQWLKCEECGLEYSNNKDTKDYWSIEEYGCCCDCGYNKFK
jgi:hypothetical protein